MAPQTHDAAVLFVHGIGDQHRGDTLDEFGGSLIDRARQWFGVANVWASAPRNVHDDPLRLAAADRPLAEREVVVARPGDATLRLLLAESHWAGEVQAPSWGILMRWLTGTVPFIVQRAADAWMRRLSRRVDSVAEQRSVVVTTPAILALAVLRTAVNVLAVGLALIVVLALLALGVLARLQPVRDACFGNNPRPFAKWVQVLAGLSLVPIAWLASRGGADAIGAAAVASAFPAVVLLSLATRLRSLVVSFVGDSYALVADPISSAAIVARVERDLGLLEQRAAGAPVVIVAHSQGAEVVHQVLARRISAAPVESLVTFGAGIAKLHATRRLRSRRGPAACAFALRLVSATCACAGALAVLGGWHAPLAPFGGPALLVIATGLISAARAMLRTIVGCEADAIAIGAGQVTRWTDLHASHDPVSEGDLPFGAGLGQSSTVVNRRSLLLDHVTYWHNAEGFQTAVAREIERAACGWRTVATSAALARAVDQRTRMVDRGLHARAAVVAFAGGLLWALQPPLYAGALIVGASLYVLVRVTRAIDAGVARRSAALVNPHVTEIPRAAVQFA
jgi:hypothetical protein